MLTELRVRNLGVIEDLSLVFGPGMTALTGETGAGKTLIVDAIGLLLGGPADPAMVRPGADEAEVEGRFTSPSGEETVLCRVVPAAGRSRAYADGRMAGAAQLSEIGSALVDMHGQHAHQSLLRPSEQRALLDRFAGISTEAVDAARTRVKEIVHALEGIGGDARERAREADLLVFQLEELEAAGITGPDEDEVLRAEEERLSDAEALREAAGQVHEGLSGDGGIIERIGLLAQLLAPKPVLAEIHSRLVTAVDELSDVARDSREAGESLEADPARLAEIGNRRQLLTGLRRKYGETLAEVIAYRDECRTRLEELERHDERAAELEGQLQAAEVALSEAELTLHEARRKAAPTLSAAIERRLRELAMPRAAFAVEIGYEPPGDSVTWMLGANPGEPVLALSKVASGGELARTMLAARLALGVDGGEGPSTLVFDEVDAGIGGEAATSVGRALSDLAHGYQVLVVTHLPQVAACASRQLAVRKDVMDGRTVAGVSLVEGSQRVIEISRMLSGSPESETARRHAEELLASAPAGAYDGAAGAYDGAAGAYDGAAGASDGPTS